MLPALRNDIDRLEVNLHSANETNDRLSRDNKELQARNTDLI